MTGFRKEATYVKKYGEEIGKQKFQKVLAHRDSRLHRRSVDESMMVTCELCKKQFKRITRTHLAHSCIESITTAEYLQRFPDTSLMSSDLKSLYRNTKETIIEKYGEDNGSKKWKDYCSVQSLTNSFEYKAEKYNLTREEFNSYNTNRSSTLENFIARHGEEAGLLKWDEYRERQRYTTSIGYFIEKYGEVVGIEKYENFCKGRNMIDKLQSKIEVEAYRELSVYLDTLEQSVRLDNIYYGPYDYGNISEKKLIEFYGTYWHADPRFYDSHTMLLQKNQTAKQIWARDQAKRTFATNNGFYVYVIWEHDWRKNKQQTIENILRWWNDNK